MAEPNGKRQPVTISIGCGTAPLPPQEPGAPPPIGVDHDLGALREVNRWHNGGPVVCADARALPFRERVGAALSLDAVLHHLTPVRESVEELARVLAPGGLLTIADGLALPPDESAQLDAELAAAGLPVEPINGFDPGQLKALVRRAGLQVEGFRLEGTATFATPPYVSRPYRSRRFVLTVSRSSANTSS